MNIKTFCNLPLNETFSPWNWKLNSFTQCFLWVPVETGSLALFAIVCGYLYGKSRNLQVQKQKNYVSWLIVITAMSQDLLSSIELTLSYVTHQGYCSGAYVMVKCISIITWFTCLLLHFKSLNIVNMKQRNKVLCCSFLFVFISSAMQLHYTISQMIYSNHAIMLNHIGSCIQFFLHFLFLMSCLKIACTKIDHRCYSGIVENLLVEDDKGDYDIEPKDQDIFLGKAQLYGNCLSFFFFCWVNKLLLKGFHKQLKNPECLFILPDDLQIGTLEDNFERNLSKHSSKNKDSFIIFKALQSSFGCFYYSLGILKFLCDVLGFAGPVLLNYLVSFIENKQV